MSTDVFSAAPEAPLGQVARTMAEHKYGCAVIVDGGKVAGVVTTTDLCRALAELLG